MLRERGVLPTQMIFGATETGKPYIVRSLVLRHVQNTDGFQENSRNKPTHSLQHIAR